MDATRVGHLRKKRIWRAFRLKGESPPCGELNPTFESVGVPRGFHRTAAEVLRLVASVDLNGAAGVGEGWLAGHPRYI